MNLVHLKYALEVEKTGSITKAAENLFMGQPNLSKSIKELESSLGIKIFKRTASGALPTKAGETFLGYAHAVLEQIAQMEAIYNPGNKDHASFSVAVPRCGYISYAFAEYIHSLCSLKQIDVYFKEAASLDTISYVADGECNLGIIRCKCSDADYYLHVLGEKGLKPETLCEYDYLVMMSKNNPLALCADLTQERLCDCIEIFFDDQKTADPEVRSIKRVYIGDSGTQIDVLQRVDESYMWSTPLESAFLESHGLVQKKLRKGGARVRDILICHKAYKFTCHEQAFFDEIVKLRDRIM